MRDKLRLVITGTPGVGKTTIAKELAARLGLEYVNLNEELIRRGVCKYNPELSTYEITDVDKAVQILDTVVESYARAVFDTLLVELLNPDLIDLVIVLRLDPRVLYRRLRNERGWVGQKLCENVLAEILDYFLIKSVENFGEDNVLEIDTTGKSIEDVINEILNFLEGRNNEKREEKRVGIVSWLDKVDPSFLVCLDMCREGLVTECEV